MDLIVTRTLFPVCFFFLSIIGSSCETRVAGGKANDSSKASFSVEGLEIRGASQLDDQGHETLKEQVREQLRLALEEDGSVVFGAEAENQLTGVLTFELLPDPQAPSSTLLHMLLSLRGRDQYGAFSIQGESWASGTESQQQRQLENACEELSKQITLSSELVQSSAAELSLALTASQNDRVMAALHEVSRRRLEQHLEPLRDLLVHPERDIVIKAASVLGQMKDSKAVPRLSDLLTSPDPEKIHQAIFALGDICGEEAVQALKKGRILFRNQPVEELFQEKIERCTPKSESSK